MVVMTRRSSIFIIRNRVTKEEKIFPSLTSVGKYFGMSRSWAYQVLKRHDGYYKDLWFIYEQPVFEEGEKEHD